ncbi:MAG: carbonic anhydrase [Candidatus Uhrbacteria bacterium]
MHHCHHALIRCMDFRLQKAVDEWLEENHLPGDCDMISVAGAGKDVLVNPDGFVATQIGLSKKLHDTKTVLLMHHMDCGAYGGHSAFENLEAEKEFQVSEMKKIKEIIESKNSEMEVKMLLAHIDDDGEVEIEAVG